MTSRVLCDRNMHVRLKAKCYKTIIRLAMLYDSKVWAATGQHIHKTAIAEMMLKWMTGKINHELVAQVV